MEKAWIKANKDLSVIEWRQYRGLDNEEIEKKILTIKDVQYTKDVTIIADVAESIKEELSGEIQNSTRGKAEISYI